MISTNIPFDVLTRNKIPKPWDDYVIRELEKTKNFSDIISGHEILSRMATPSARKEVAKTIYSIGEQPDLTKQKFEIKEVMGSVGEELTELLLPDKDVGVNNSGYDVDFCGNYIEVKSTVKEKALMSSIQYLNANYLLVHKFDKDTGQYCSSLLAPLSVVHFFKLDRKKSVSVSTKTDKWARNLKITLHRVILFFYNTRSTSTNRDSEVCKKCHSSILVNGEVQLGELTNPCKDCFWKNWESRYQYYYYRYIQQPRLSTDVPRVNSTASSIENLMVIEGKNGRFLNGGITIDANDDGSSLSVYYCPSVLVKSKARLNQSTVVYDFTELLDYLSEALDDQKIIKEFSITIDSKAIECMIRSNMAPIKPGFYNRKFKLAQEPDFLKKSIKLIKLAHNFLANET
ncbi:hypothetical protein [Vibrio gazogenes]|uniref:Uncharacterized protein n=1 Tax=Vibrio gazogenes DSM 21264 = NBRC 103151 TaxID=1123492 RepID=A0A1M5G0Z1_VIBGA|nr:hypothetical protein [Vibrio gazogenes]USP14719.1 hypothetical protein MKS89_05240 [Vibrio gazogenes]SHF97102.1 hypothetical protein SAMN02745781_03646 [Vibrio gazogenes DSM 21264] [Vibrio gazogenes DSM 21264 = NBRC 103151]SJN52887.1 hypothetical protein BQ6471_00133 [Vibrio gazogenes]